MVRSDRRVASGTFLPPTRTLDSSGRVVSITLVPGVGFSTESVSVCPPSILERWDFLPSSLRCSPVSNTEDTRRSSIRWVFLGFSIISWPGTGSSHLLELNLDLRKRVFHKWGVRRISVPYRPPVRMKGPQGCPKSDHNPFCESLSMNVTGGRPHSRPTLLSFWRRNSELEPTVFFEILKPTSSD